ncbi:hypothetical protein BDV10DRAFT_157955 [Aspergillus recurvatus]
MRRDKLAEEVLDSSREFGGECSTCLYYVWNAGRAPHSYHLPPTLLYKPALENVPTSCVTSIMIAGYLPKVNMQLMPFSRAIQAIFFISVVCLAFRSALFRGSRGLSGLSRIRFSVVDEN